MALDGTYGGLQASIAAWATRSDLTATIPDFIAWAHQEIARKLRANVLLSSADVAVSAETVAQPAGFLAIKTFYLDVTPRVFLGVVSQETAQERNAQFGAGTYPDSVAVEGSNFRFSPLFTSGTTGKLSYYAEPAGFTNAASTNVVLTKYPYLYLYGSLEALFRYLEDDNNTDRYGALFGALIASVNDEAAKDLMRGPLSPQASPVSIA